MRLRLLAVTFIGVLLLGPAPVRGQVDEMTRLVVSYDLKLETTEHVAAFYEDFAKWARTHSKERKKLDKESKAASLEKTIALFDKNPQIKSLLDEHQIKARDALLLPLALFSSQAMDYAEQRGIKMPAEAVNRTNVNLVRADSAKIESLSKRISKARKVFEGSR